MKLGANPADSMPERKPGRKASPGIGEAKRLAPIALALALSSSCAPLFEPAYGTSIQYASSCRGYICRYDSLMRTTRPVREGDTVESIRAWSSVSYQGWIISGIGEDGVELKPAASSGERVFIPYGYTHSVESNQPYPYYFGSSLVFEKGQSPGTAVMTIVERPY